MGTPRFSRLYALDGLRLIAALMVALFHFAGKQVAVWDVETGVLFPGLSQIARYGSLGVELFFLISGFVICLSSWGRTPKDFLISRIVRIYPAYWIAVLLIAGVGVLYPAIQRRPELDEFIINFTLLQEPAGAKRILGVDWTLWVELRFYLIFMIFVIWRGVNYRSVFRFCCAWTMLAVLSTSMKIASIDLLIMGDYASYFIAGLTFYLIYRFKGTPTLWLLIGINWAVGQYLTVRNWWNPDTPPPLLPRSPLILVGIITIFFLIMALAATHRLDRIQWPFLAIAGALSYPLYLIHEHLGWLTIHLAFQEWGWSAYQALFFTLGIVTVIAALIHFLVERPAAPRLKALLLQAAHPPSFPENGTREAQPERADYVDSNLSGQISVNRGNQLT